MRGLLREPLTHFILIGLAVFLAYGWLGARDVRSERTITVTRADMERMAALYTAEAGALPSEADLQAMLIDHVQQEALVREARRLGLDAGDTVVDRRLAQKMSFMLTDMTELTDPGDQVLEDWYQTHKSEFEIPASLSFEHVYYSGALAQPADAILASLTSPQADWRSLGDPFMLQRAYAALPQRELVRIFGPDFADSLMTNPKVGVWFGPVTSPFGRHFVRITQYEPSRMPLFQEARLAVLADWMDTERQTRNAEALADLVEKYEVKLEGMTP